MKYTLVLLPLLLIACASSEKKEISPSDKVVEQFSSGDSEYNGFYNQFEFRATLLNTKVQEAQIQKQAIYYKWDESKAAAEREKSAQTMSQKTDIFISFFTPERRNDNLADTKSIWRVFLDAGGHRYSGEVRKLRKLLAELQSLYPYHTRWNTAYVLSFPISTSIIETQPSRLTITGPLGTRSVEFSPVVAATP